MSDVGWTDLEILEKNNEIHRMLNRVGLDDRVQYYISSDRSGGYEAVVEIREDRWMTNNFYFNSMEEAEALIAERFPQEAEDAGWL